MHATIDPLPFRVRIPGSETLDARGIRSVGYRLEGLLHLTGATLSLEWAATETVQSLSATGAGGQRQSAERDGNAPEGAYDHVVFCKRGHRFESPVKTLYHYSNTS